MRRKKGERLGYGRPCAQASAWSTHVYVGKCLVIVESCRYNVDMTDLTPRQVPAIAGDTQVRFQSEDTQLVLTVSSETWMCVSEAQKKIAESQLSWWFALQHNEHMKKSVHVCISYFGSISNTFHSVSLTTFLTSQCHRHGNASWVQRSPAIQRFGGEPHTRRGQCTHQQQSWLTCKVSIRCMPPGRCTHKWADW